ncbi:hypothetical protein EYF80_013871 [Liparis tanakae]|uniref:Uncharacterized protein n=1 Tax=Liparis tanakae TaxID=230148 RepID=A0A4Z2IDT1_9TELE|nr:hypothetical protein EYF80_013871 [Liparis tanakae]
MPCFAAKNWGGVEKGRRWQSRCEDTLEQLMEAKYKMDGSNIGSGCHVYSLLPSRVPVSLSGRLIIAVDEAWDRGLSLG